MDYFFFLLFIRMEQNESTPGTASEGATPGLMYGTVCRVNFWIKMTTALGVTQIVIGVGCIVFYAVGFFMKIALQHPKTYVAVGVVAGGVVSTQNLSTSNVLYILPIFTEI
jgi:riboflavin transporter FmnP